MCRRCNGTDEEVLARIEETGRAIAKLKRERTVLLKRMRYRRRLRLSMHAKSIESRLYHGRTYDEVQL